MNITPKGGTTPVNPQAGFQKAQELRANAIAKFNQSPQPEQKVVANQNQISVEELGAIRQPSKSIESNGIPELEAQDSQPEARLNEPAKAPEDPISSQYAQLARREKQLRLQAQKQQQSIQAREDALKAKEAALAAKDSEYQSGYISKDQLKRDTLKILNENGVPYEQLVQQYINETTNPVDPRVNATISALQDKIAKLEANAQDSEKRGQEQQTQAYESAVKQIRLDAVSLIRSEPDTYEMIQATKSIDDVVDLIKRTHAEEGRIMSVEEAATEVENYLFEESLRLANLKKVRSRTSQASTPDSSKVQTPPSNQSKQPQQMKTLTNAATNSRQLSSKERAILAFKGQL